MCDELQENGDGIPSEFAVSAEGVAIVVDHQPVTEQPKARSDSPVNYGSTDDQKTSAPQV